MPTVSHVRFQQGYRPLTRRKPALAGARALGLGNWWDDLTSGDFMKALQGSGAMLTPPWWTYLAPGSAGLYDLYQVGNVVVGSSPGDPLLSPGNLTGTLTNEQVAQIKQEATQGITQAAGGNQALADAQIAQMNADLDKMSGGGLPTWAWVAIAVAGAFVVGKAL